MFSGLHKIMVNKVTFAGFWVGDRPNHPLWIRSCPNQERIQAVSLEGVNSVILGSQVLLRILFSELYREYCLPNCTKS